MEDNKEIKELLKKIILDIEEIKEKVNVIENNQINVANAEHENWHRLADKLSEYDRVLYKLFGKKPSDS